MAIEADVVERVMHLSSEDRAELARRLILSLEPDDAEKDAEMPWAVKIERRVTAYERGETAAVDWRDAVERTKQTMRKNQE